MKKHRNKKKCDRKIVSAACMALACILLSRLAHAEGRPRRRSMRSASE